MHLSKYYSVVIVEIEASAPGKVILLGEHFVVHGSHALSMAINKFARATAIPDDKLTILLETYDGRNILLSRDKESFASSFFKILKEDYNLPDMNINIRLEFPLSAGLGSSASIGAILTEIAYKYKYDEIPPIDIYMKYVDIMEKIVHKTPSGVDHHTIIHGGIILYKKDLGIVDSIQINDLELLVIDSGERRDTGILVSKVLEKKDILGKQRFNELVKQVDSLVLEGFSYISKNELDKFGEVMRINQKYLEMIGVSTPTIDFIINTLNSLGAYGSKLTGAGGGGCIISLIPKEYVKNIVDKFLKNQGLKFFFVKPYYSLK